MTGIEAPLGGPPTKSGAARLKTAVLAIATATKQYGKPRQVANHEELSSEALLLGIRPQIPIPKTKVHCRYDKLTWQVERFHFRLMRS